MIFRTLTMHLFNRAQPTTPIDERQTPASSRKQIEELLRHLAKKNPYFALWCAYKRGVSDRSIVEKWDDYLIQELGPQCAETIDFTRAMVELDRLLTLFHDESLPLPNLAFERIWFLHYLRGPERMAQTRAVLRHTYGGVGGMHIRVISFGTNWWAMRSRDADNPFCFRRNAAYFNAAATSVGKASPSQRDLSRSNSLQREEWI